MTKERVESLVQFIRQGNKFGCIKFELSGGQTLYLDLESDDIWEFEDDNLLYFTKKDVVLIAYDSIIAIHF